MNVDGDALASYAIRAALATTLVGTVYFWGEWFWVMGAWLALGPLALLYAFVLGFFVESMGGTTQQVLFLDVEGERIVERSPEIVGHLRDHKIHEWVMLEHPESKEHIKLLYERVVDIDNWDPPEERWFALEPGGVLYVQPENSAAATLPSA